MPTKKQTKQKRKPGKSPRLGGGHWGLALIEELYVAGQTMGQDAVGMPDRFRKAFAAREGHEILGTNTTIHNGYELLDAIVLGVGLGPHLPESAIALRHAVAAIRSKGGEYFQRHVIATQVKHAISRWKSEGASDEIAAQLRIAFGRYRTGAFEAAITTFRRELSRSDKRGHLLIAAALSVALGMWGDTDEGKSKKAFLEAERSARR